MTHHEPFTSPVHLVHDLAIGAWLVFVLLPWEELRRWRVVRMP